MPANLENSAVATGLEKVSFHSNPKKGNAKECSDYHMIALISHSSKAKLKIFQENISLNESFNIIYICDIKKECLNTLKVYFAKYSIFMLSMYFLNFQTFKLDLEKSEEPKIKLPTSIGSLKKWESSRKNIYFCFIDYTKAFDCVDHNKLEKS